MPARNGSQQYRVVAQRAPDGDLTVVAVPLRETDQTLHRLLLVESLVVASVLLLLGLLAWLLVRLGLRPLDRIGATAGAIAAGDLSRRVSPASEVRDVVHEPVDLTRIARDAVDDARATAPDREIGLEAGTGAVVFGEPSQLRQVLLNLLRNALQHTPAGSPIEVRATRAGATVRLEVRDHGPGLATSDGAALFERFWRAEAGRERGRAGAGLGLAIVAGIVDAHRGTVDAANAPGGGALFTVELPAAAATEPAEAPRPGRDRVRSDA